MILFTNFILGFLLYSKVRGYHKFGRVNKSSNVVILGRIQEGIRELEPLQSNRDVVLGTCLALVHAHKKCKTVGKIEILTFLCLLSLLTLILM